ncbi:MAG: 50S ribosomal protein L29 [Cyanobacteria bacterium SIG27]|jgi:large subunit ribosomal protein L29|nr:50S ribosomal protein L29 [Cyanobacteria bacterium SIG27]MBR5304848.1 50S ribosomal protein L29 [Candidatus Gastranaerophilales bacterium]
MKLQEIKEKSVDELKELILESKKELFTLRMGHNKLKQLENTASIKNTKKLIARAKTVLRQKELQA